MATYTIGSGGDFATFAAFETATTLPEVGGTILNVTGTIVEDFTPTDADYLNGLTIQALSGEDADGVLSGAFVNGHINPACSTDLFQLLKLNVTSIQLDSMNNTEGLVQDCDIGNLTAVDAVTLVGSTVMELDNCIIRDGADDGVFSTSDTAGMKVNRCTVVDAARFGALRSVFMDTLVIGSGTDDYFSPSAGSDFNASSDLTAEGFTASYHNRTTADLENYAAGNYNLAASSSLNTLGSGGGRVGALLAAAAAGSILPQMMQHLN